jgi:hypothetical protein
MPLVGRSLAISLFLIYRLWPNIVKSLITSFNNDNNNNISVAVVRDRNIPTERPPFVGEVIANFCGLRVPRGQRGGTLRSYSRFSRQEPLLFYEVAPQLYSRG